MSEVAQPNRMRGFTTLDIIIRRAIHDIGGTMSRYEQFKGFAIEGYQDFHFDLAAEIKTVRLSLTAWKAVYLPVDYVDWALLGVEINGAIEVFTNDNRIPLPTIDDDEDGVLDAPTVPVVYPADQLPVSYQFWNITNNGEDAGKMFGLTTKDNGIGYFKMNPERKEIQFSPSIDGGTVIYMEYISDGFNPCEATVVNIYAAKLIKLYVHWQRLKFSKYPRIMVKEAKDDYWAEWYRVQGRIHRVTVEDVLECARDGYKLISSF